MSNKTSVSETLNVRTDARGISGALTCLRMGSVIVLFSRDFRQTLLVMPRPRPNGARVDEVKRRGGKYPTHGRTAPATLAVNGNVLSPPQ